LDMVIRFLRSYNQKGHYGDGELINWLKLDRNIDANPDFFRDRPETSDGELSTGMRMEVPPRERAAQAIAAVPGGNPRSREQIINDFLDDNDET